MYKKVGRKYVPIGYSDNFNGFPSEGLWVVYNKPGVKSSSCIAQAGQFQPIDYSLLASMIKEREAACLAAILQLRNRQEFTASDIVRTVFETLLNKD